MSGDPRRVLTALTGSILLLVLAFSAVGCTVNPTPPKPVTVTPKPINAKDLKVVPSTGELAEDVEPAITRERAIELASRSLDFVPNETSAKLRVWPSRGEPRLQWLVLLSGGVPIPGTELQAAHAVSICIDAMNGDIIAPY